METKKSLTPIYELELSDGISLKIHVKKAKKGILSIILFFALSIFFIPIIVCIYLATTSEGIPFGFIIGILIKRLGSYPLTIEEVLMSVNYIYGINMGQKSLL